MQTSKTTAANDTNGAAAHALTAPQAPRRITSGALLQERREVEIEHGGKIYRLRVTQLNKLILTA
jgi:hemin uptake protein HemP